MGKKDDYQFDYLDDNSRFADQINGALFNGRKQRGIQQHRQRNQKYAGGSGKYKDTGEV